MATTDVAQQLVEAAKNDPNLLSQLTENPSGAVKSVTGLDLSSQEIAEALTCASKIAKGENVDMGTVASLAADLFSKHGGDLTKIVGALFGGDQAAASTTTTQTATQSGAGSEGGIDLGEVAGLAETLLGGESGSTTSGKKTSSSGGIDLGEVAGLAETLLGGSGKTTGSGKKTSKKTSSSQSGGGLDLGGVANIAEELFGGK
ncbi:MAG: hypothetical protein WAY93_05475 [Atopobiaceae bacterium]|jgi:hypothetical protein|nr:hypothetical protein [Atopobiaceae bacterium]